MAGLADRLLSTLAYIDPPDQAPPRRRYEVPELPVSPLPLQGPTAAPMGVSHAPRPSERPSAPVRPGKGVVYVGDSLGVGTAPHIGTKRVDVLGGRSSASGVQALRGMLRKRDAGTVIFDLGTNDWTRGDLAHSIRQATRLAGADTQLVIPTVRGRRAAQKNRLIHRMAARNPGIEVVEWARAPDRLVSGDRIHATPGGYRRRANMIRRYL